MPVHDWTCVDAGIFHDFHHEWISTLRRALNDGLLPPDYYALAEQHAAGFGPDVLTLQNIRPESEEGGSRQEPSKGSSGLLLAFFAIAESEEKLRSAPFSESEF